MNEVFISLIIPVYNGEKYIPQIIQSISRLNYNNYEIIFVDDGSKDKTYDLLTEYQKSNNKIRIIRQKNAGVSAARNKGIECSNGQYLCFVDVDDEISPDYLLVFNEYLQKTGVKLAFCDFSTNYIKTTDNIRYELYKKNDILNDFLERKIQIGVWGMIVDSNVLKENNLYFKVGYKYSEDLHMIWRMFNSVEKVLHVKVPMYIYKENEGSAMSKIDESRLDSIYLMQDLEGYFEENNSVFYNRFKKYGVARTTWAVLWQAAHYKKSFEEFKNFLTLYDFDSLIKKLVQFPDNKVKLSSYVFLFSKRLYYYCVKVATKTYRSN